MASHDCEKRFSRFAFDNRSRGRFPLAAWHKALSGTRPGVPAAQHSGGCFRGFQHHREFRDGENATLEFRASEPRQCDGRVDRAASESAVVAKSPLPRIIDFAKERGWRRLRLLSTAGNRYDRDYFGDSMSLAAAIRVQQEFKAGEEWDMPMLNVFRRDGKTIRHFWGSEILFVPPEPGQEYRHNDALDPLWNMLDLTPAGRGNFHPQLSYA
jgi:Bacterial protein of unknown function (DUF899)